MWILKNLFILVKSVFNNVFWIYFNCIWICISVFLKIASVKQFYDNCNDKFKRKKKGLRLHDSSINLLKAFGNIKGTLTIIFVF